MRLLRWFHRASGLKINWGKSTLSGISVPEAETSKVASLVGCKEDSFPLKYLGLPIGASMSKEEHWKPIADKFKKKLSVWKANTLSIGGKLTL